MENELKQIKEMVEAANTNKALEALEQLVDIHFKDQANSLSLLTARYSNLEKNYLQGLLDDKEYTIQLNKVNKYILLFTDGLKKGPTPVYKKYNVLIILLFWGIVTIVLFYLYQSPAKQVEIEIENLCTTQVLFYQRNAVDFFEQSLFVSNAQLQGYQRVVIKGDSVNLSERYQKATRIDEALILRPNIDGTFLIKNSRIGGFTIHPFARSKISIEARTAYASSFIVNNASSILVTFYPLDTVEWQVADNVMEGLEGVESYDEAEINAQLIYTKERENIYAYGDSSATFVLTLSSKEALNMEQVNMEIDTMEFVKRKKNLGEIRLESTLKGGIIYIKHPEKRIKIQENEFLNIKNVVPFGLRNLKIEEGLIYLNLAGKATKLEKGANNKVMLSLMPTKLEVLVSQHKILLILLFVICTVLSFFYYNMTKQKIEEV